MVATRPFKKGGFGQTAGLLFIWVSCASLGPEWNCWRQESLGMIRGEGKRMYWCPVAADTNDCELGGLTRVR